MKKVLSVLCVIIAFFIVYFLQINFFSWFNIAGVKPNLFILLTLFVGLFMDKRIAAVLGFIMGIYLDILTAKQVGISAIVFTFLGYICGFLDNRFSKDSKLTIMLMVIASTFVYEVIVYIYLSISNNVSLDVLGFLRILGIELLFNGLLTIILYPIIRDLGDICERIFNEKKVGLSYIMSSYNS